MLITTPDGRDLEVLDTGGDGLPCVFHHGTPGGPVPYRAATAAAAAAGLRWISYARPGYGDSTPLAGRTVAQAAADTGAVLDALGLGEFVTYGWSGGGPHALACGALLADRCRAVSTIASVAPYGAPGLDFLAGMGEGNLEEFALVLQGRDALLPFLEQAAEGLREVTAEQVAAELDSVIDDVDRAAITGELAEELVASFRASVRRGVHGWVDDDLAFVQPWGFDLAEMRVPVMLWQGAHDLMVPLAHGQWLASRLPGVRARLLPDEGHVSLVADPTEILAELART